MSQNDIFDIKQKKYTIYRQGKPIKIPEDITSKQELSISFSMIANIFRSHK